MEANLFQKFGEKYGTSQGIGTIWLAFIGLFFNSVGVQ